MKGPCSPVALAAVVAGILTLGCSAEDAPGVREGQSPLSQAPGAEAELNDSPATANPIGASGVIRASIQPSGEHDYFSFEAKAGDRVHAAVVSAASSMGTDSILDLFGPDGVTLVESDNDNGSLPGNASSIAGAALIADGTHYLRVRSGDIVRPYDLHFRIQTGTPVAEIEPNDLLGLAQPLPPSGWVSGNITSPGDIDFYALSLNPGDTLFASLDLDPERNGTELAGVLSIGPFGGSFLQVDDPGGFGPDSEALVATVKEGGTYGIAVSSAFGTGNYHLSVSVHPAATGNCKHYTSAGGAVSIPTGPGEVVSTLEIPDSPRIADIDVSVSLSHASPPDLDVVLEAPNGNHVALFTDVGSPSVPDIDVTIDDEAAFPVTSFNLLSGLAVQPEPTFRLGWLRGQDAGGTWKLHVFDDSPINGGTLHAWGLTICEPPPDPPCAGGSAKVTPLFADFESDDAGFTHSGALDSWARGTPAQPPHFTTCHSGTGCFKTNLSGDYPNGSSQDLVSPPIDLAAVKPPIRASWAMRYQMETATYDHAWVEVRTADGAALARPFEWADATMTVKVGHPQENLDEVAGWGVHTADLSPFAGQTIQIVFHLDADQGTSFPGVAVDDVTITACPLQDCGNGVVEGTELCDDGNLVEGDGCDTSCTPSACGNGIRSPAEECDDGNTEGGDGCSAECTSERPRGGIFVGVGALSAAGAGGAGAGSGEGAEPGRVLLIGGGGGCGVADDASLPAPWTLAVALAGLALLLLRRRRAAR